MSMPERKAISLASQVLNRGPATAAEIARVTGLTHASVGSALYALNVEGTIERAGTWTPPVGRPHVKWKFRVVAGVNA